MNHETDYQSFIDMLDGDLTIGKNHLIDDLPPRFTAPDFLYFFALKDYFWRHVSDEEHRWKLSLAMTECYLSALLDISSGDYQFSETSHHLENCILYGDLLSGAFCKKLIDLNRIDVLDRWLVLLQEINKELLRYSRDGKGIREKKLYLVGALVSFLSDEDAGEEQVNYARKLLVDGELVGIPANLPEYAKSLLTVCGSAVISSADDLRALKKVSQ